MVEVPLKTALIARRAGLDGLALAVIATAAQLVNTNRIREVPHVRYANPENIPIRTVPLIAGKRQNHASLANQKCT
jgi:hypothetical protein